MRCIFILISFLGLALHAFGQQETNQVLPFEQRSTTPTDTLIPGTSFTPTLYPINSNLGYVAGTNAYDDRAKAQKYSVSGLSESYDLLGLMFWFGRRDPSSGSSITLHVYDLSGSGTGLNGSITAPSGSLYSQSFPLDSITTSEPNFVLFANPIPIWYDYALGFDYSSLAATDTLALLSSFNGEGGMDELSIELKEDGSWYSLLESWSNVTASFFFDANLALFPIIDRGSVGIEEVEGFHSFTNPAPAELVIRLNAQKSDLERINLLDMQGRRVQTHLTSRLNEDGDEDIFRVDIRDLAPGTYILYFEHASPLKDYGEKLLVY